MTKQTKEIREVLMVLNAADDMGFKYPIGNKELCERVKGLEATGKIGYIRNGLNGRWVKGKVKADTSEGSIC